MTPMNNEDPADEIERLTADYAAATHLLADRDAHIERLKAELATLRASAASVQADQRAEIDAANAVIDELRADAERYRWLRTQPEWLGWEHDFRSDEIDREVDAARALRKGTT